MYFNELVAAYEKERRDRDIFHDLMRYRVREILLVASLYDAFILESDGALSDQIYGEYFKLNLTSAPRVSCAYTPEAALEMYKGGDFDMVIIMAALDFDDPLDMASRMKDYRRGTPILLLAMNNSSLAGLGPECRAALSNIDRVFVWNGYSKLFVGMIKYVEDLRNADNDTRVGMVRVILLIEDSIRYYSRYLPLLYSVVMKQTQQLVEEEQEVETYKILRMRGRPKIILATSYEEALAVYERYEPYLLTVISDVRFIRSGQEDPRAGFRFLQMTKNRKPDLAVLIQSSEPENQETAHAMGASFADKNSNTLGRELSSFFQNQLGFGPFIFRGPDGKEYARARNMQEFEEFLRSIPAESLKFHAARNHFSAWLMARGEVRFARIIRNYMLEDFAGPAELRDFICRVLDDLRKGKARGSIPGIGAGWRDHGITRLGGGSVGGKGRGLAFIKSLIDNMAFERVMHGIQIRLPYTAFIGIDEFEFFMEQNGLWNLAWYSTGDTDIRREFMSRPLSSGLVDRLRFFLSTTDKPLAVRSSGLFEDMLMIPFSGVYDTFLIPNAHPDADRRLTQLCDAIKLIYASLFSESARTYFDAASYKIEEERMAIVIQELVGQRRGRWFFPLISGTAQSYNYYPVAYLKPDDGLCVSALGLGPYVVEGGEAYRFSPRYPKLDVVSTSQRTSGTQRWFYALDMERSEFDLLAGEEATMSRLDIAEAEADPDYRLIASTWSIDDDRLEPGISARGPRILDFAPTLKYDAIPLAKVVEASLEVGAKSMGIPVEIEYALSMDGDGGTTPTFYLLQIKPLIQNADKVQIDVEGVERSECLVVSDRCMGNGRVPHIHDIIFVDPRRFDRSRTEAIAKEISILNERLRTQNQSYVLIGPGRWGTRDRWLGIPVAFSQISGARTIIEADLPDFQVDSSLGSHFFHNVTAMNIGYFSVAHASTTAFVDWSGLAALPIADRTEHCVHVRTEEPIEVMMDGRKGHGIIRKPAVRLTGDEKTDNIYCT
jgi:hypothetical protein